MSAADDVADASFDSFDDVIEKWSQLSPKTLLATVQRDGLFIGHGGARHDMNADVAESFLVALYPAWSAFFEEALPALIRRVAGLSRGRHRACTDRSRRDRGYRRRCPLAVLRTRGPGTDRPRTGRDHRRRHRSTARRVARRLPIIATGRRAIDQADRSCRVSPPPRSRSRPHCATRRPTSSIRGWVISSRISARW